MEVTKILRCGTCGMGFVEAQNEQYLGHVALCLKLEKGHRVEFVTTFDGDTVEGTGEVTHTSPIASGWNEPIVWIHSEKKLFEPENDAQTGYDIDMPWSHVTRIIAEMADASAAL